MNTPPAPAVSGPEATRNRAADAALAAVDAWLGSRPPLAAMSDARFLEALEAFEAASDQRGQIAAALSNRSLAPGPKDELAWLSIGCGGGDLDVAVAAALAERFPRQRYVGVDPNEVECQRCRTLFAERFPQFEATVFAQGFENFDDDPQSFDLVYAAHTFYYVDDVGAALARGRRLLRPGGAFVVLHAPLGALNVLADRFWRAPRGRAVPYSDVVGRRLEGHGATPARSRIDAWLDVTECVSRNGAGDAGPSTERGRAILDFILQLDTTQLPASVMRAVSRYLDAISHDEGPLRLAPHPVDAFVIR
ncbi:MAG: class I SAM-dependent methyltransferase [Myxococcota bacterium]